jgi:hypothetical protein
VYSTRLELQGVVIVLNDSTACGRHSCHHCMEFKPEYRILHCARNRGGMFNVKKMQQFSIYICPTAVFRVPTDVWVSTHMSRTPNSHKYAVHMSHHSHNSMRFTTFGISCGTTSLVILWIVPPFKYHCDIFCVSRMAWVNPNLGSK